MSTTSTTTSTTTTTTYLAAAFRGFYRFDASHLSEDCDDPELPTNLTASLIIDHCSTRGSFTGGLSIRGDGLDRGDAVRGSTNSPTWFTRMINDSSTRTEMTGLPTIDIPAPGAIMIYATPNVPCAARWEGTWTLDLTREPYWPEECW